MISGTCVWSNWGLKQFTRQISSHVCPESP
jgi:hypothetical protein